MVTELMDSIERYAWSGSLEAFLNEMVFMDASDGSGPPVELLDRVKAAVGDYRQPPRQKKQRRSPRANPEGDLSPGQIADRLNCDVDHVYGLIRSGELRAKDVSARPGRGRARYRISLHELDAFNLRRSVGVQAPARSMRRKRKLKYF